MSVVGLQNQGNTCYMNSALQLMVNSTYIRQEIMKQDNKFAKALQEIIYSKECMTPFQIKQLIGQENSMFSGSLQQDSHEFITTCLTLLQNSDFQEIKYYEEMDFNCDYSTGFQQYKDYSEKRSNSKLQQQLRFYTIHETFCKNCGIQGYSFHTDENLMLQFKQNSSIQNTQYSFQGYDEQIYEIEQLLDSYFEDEDLGRCCKNCSGNLFMKQRLWTLPSQLIIVLARFTEDSNKLDNQVNYNMNMSLLKYLHDGAPPNQLSYKLEAVSLHSGYTSCGHYTAYVVTPDQQMFDCNDSYVNKISSVINDPRAYVLSYAIESNPKLPQLHHNITKINYEENLNNYAEETVNYQIFQYKATDYKKILEVVKSLIEEYLSRLMTDSFTHSLMRKRAMKINTDSKQMRAILADVYK